MYRMQLLLRNQLLDFNNEVSEFLNKHYNQYHNYNMDLISRFEVPLWISLDFKMLVENHVIHIYHEWYY
jgi:hypothetical protein